MINGKAGIELKRMLLLSFFLHFSILFSSIFVLSYNDGKHLRTLTAYQVRLLSLPQEEPLVKSTPPIAPVPETKVSPPKTEIKPKVIKKEEVIPIPPKEVKKEKAISKPKPVPETKASPPKSETKSKVVKKEQVIPIPLEETKKEEVVTKPQPIPEVVFKPKEVEVKEKVEAETQTIIPKETKEIEKKGEDQIKTEVSPTEEAPKEPEKKETTLMAKVAPVEPNAPEGPSIADLPPVSPSPSAPVGTATVDVPNFKYSYYLLAIQNKVSANWFPPPGIKQDGVQEVMIAFKIRRSGEVTDVGIEKGSGNAYFDQAALRAVLRSKPLPPLPQGFFDDSLKVHFTFILGKTDG